jgi:hypothetical protein
MAYDPLMRRVVMYGGLGRNDTWEYDGATWTQQHPATSPSQPGVMAYDPAIGKIVLFTAAQEGATTTTTGGGATGGGGPETWTFDGTTWKKASPAASPRGYGGYNMTYDATLGKILLFESSSDEYMASKDVAATWTYDGTHWAKKSPSTSPSAREGASMAYDPRLSQSVLFGGQVARYRDTQELNDTWTYNGKTWTDQSSSTGPSVTTGVMAYDPSLNNLVLFGLGPAVNETWIYKP